MIGHTSSAHKCEIRANCQIKSCYCHIPFLAVYYCRVYILTQAIKKIIFIPIAVHFINGKHIRNERHAIAAQIWTFNNKLYFLWLFCKQSGKEYDSNYMTTYPNNELLWKCLHTTIYAISVRMALHSINGSTRHHFYHNPVIHLPWIYRRCITTIDKKKLCTLTHLWRHSIGIRREVWSLRLPASDSIPHSLPYIKRKHFFIIVDATIQTSHL